MKEPLWFRVVKITLWGITLSIVAYYVTGIIADAHNARVEFGVGY